MLAPCFAQNTLKKYPIGESGCSTYLFCDPGKPGVSYSEDSSVVYTMECKYDDLMIGLICVQLKESIANMDDAENMMISYADYLKTTFSITSAVGYGKGHTLNNHSTARGIIDYWKSSDGTEWNIKSWTDGSIISFMFAYGTKSSLDTHFNQLQAFFNGFRFNSK